MSAAGLEPATDGLEIRYSIQLSYAPKLEQELKVYFFMIVPL